MHDFGRFVFVSWTVLSTRGGAIGRVSTYPRMAMMAMRAAPPATARCAVDDRDGLCEPELARIVEQRPSRSDPNPCDISTVSGRPEVWQRSGSGDQDPDMPADLERIIQHALEKDPGLRYQTAAKLRDDLKRLKYHTDSGRSETASARQSALVQARTTHHDRRRRTWAVRVAPLSLPSWPF